MEYIVNAVWENISNNVGTLKIICENHIIHYKNNIINNSTVLIGTGVVIIIVYKNKNKNRLKVKDKKYTPCVHPNTSNPANSHNNYYIWFII